MGRELLVERVALEALHPSQTSSPASSEEERLWGTKLDSLLAQFLHLHLHVSGESVRPLVFFVSLLQLNPSSFVLLSQGYTALALIMYMQNHFHFTPGQVSCPLALLDETAPSD